MNRPGLIRVDLHNHMHYSPDSILSPRSFVRECRRRGLDCVAVTDHNSIHGALVVREMADFQVIVGEEIRSADGEIIGLFLQEDVPRDLPAAETIGRVKAQGGLVGVPHPFDHLRLALRKDLMLKHIDEIDFIEALNARMVFPRHNIRAREFAIEHDKPMSAGSDAHSAREVGRVYSEMPPFDGPSGLLESMRAGRLTGKLSSPLVHLISRYARLRRRFGWRPE